MARYFRLPFGTNGDREALTDETANSLVSYSTGYTQDYQRDPATDDMARRPERTLFNQLNFDITSTLQLYYQTGVPPFIAAADNNGTAFSYAIGARVRFNNRIYENTTANNTNEPTGSGWLLVDAQGADARFARRSNNLSDLTNATTARTNLDLGTAAVVDTGTGTANVPTTAQADGRYYTRTAADGRYARQSNNLSDLDSATTARSNLGLGTAATRNVGAGTSQLMQVGAFGIGGQSEIVGELNTEENRQQIYAHFNGNNRPTGTSSGIFFQLVREPSSVIQSYSQILTDNNGELWSRNRTSEWQQWNKALNNNNNLSDLTDAEIARTNLGLGTAATRATGTSNNQVPLIGNPSSAGLSAVISNITSNNNGIALILSNGIKVQYSTFFHSSGSTGTRNFPVAFDNSNYVLVGLNNQSSSSRSHFAVTQKNTANFNFQTSSGTSSNIDYIAIGS